MTTSQPETGDISLSSHAVRVLATRERQPAGALKVTGRARYAADASMLGMLWASALTSPLPHACIRSIDVSAARAAPGVHAVLTAGDIGHVHRGRRLMDWPLLAWDRVRFIGDRIAVVAAETQDAARAAVELIEVDYEELPAVFDPEAALAEDAPVLHEHAADYRYRGGTRTPVAHPNMQGCVVYRKDDADLEAAFARADRVFEHRFSTPRQYAACIEPHVALVWIEPDGTVQIVSTNKLPFDLREELALMAGLEPEQIVVDCGFVGGDFGSKGFSIDDFTCYHLARVTGRPVKAITPYAEDMQTTTTRHAATMRLRTGVTRDGLITAHEARIVFDGGAYAAPKPLADLVLPSAVRHFNAYRIPHSRMEVVSAYTNNLPGGYLRGPGNQQAIFAWESHADMIARDLGIDPLEFREHNLLREGDVGPVGQHVHRPRGEEVLGTIRQATGWGSGHLPPNRGRGVAFFTRETGTGSKAGVKLRLLPDGLVEIVTGIADQGAGAYSVIQRVAAAVLSLDPATIVVTRGTTATALPDPGPSGARATHLIGQATLKGATQLKERLESLAAEVLGWPAGRVQLAEGRFVHPDEPNQAVSFQNAAQLIGQGGPVELASEYDSDREAGMEKHALNFSALVVEVEVDPETGQVKLREAVTVTDVGAVINPVAHEGQMDGGFVFGLGAGLIEELRLEDGRVSNPNLGDYKLPSIGDVPPFRRLLLPGHDGPGPFGAKAAGELSNIGVAPAIANAIHDAIGVRLTALPITSERVLAALAEKAET